MQVVLSQRMAQPFPASPLSLYRALRSSTRRPTCSITTWATTTWSAPRPRFWCGWKEKSSPCVRSPAPARAARRASRTPNSLQELLADPKELAEHLMLIDLGRNDIGRVAQTGTVKLTEKMVIERYSHVMHIVSNVEGRLKPGLNAMDVLQGHLPGRHAQRRAQGARDGDHRRAGTQQARHLRRCGRLSRFHRRHGPGDRDAHRAWSRTTCCYVQAGAGIVADSVPDSEWMETQNKARAVLRAAEMVLAGLDNDPEP